MRSAAALFTVAALLRLSGCTSSHGGDARGGTVATTAAPATVPRDPAIPQTREELAEYLQELEYCIVNGDPAESAQERWNLCLVTNTWPDDCGIDD